MKRTFNAVPAVLIAVAISVTVFFGRADSAFALDELRGSGLFSNIEETASFVTSVMELIPDGKEVCEILSAENPELNYLVLVNGSHPMKKGWLDKAEILHSVNSRGNEIKAERAAYVSYLMLKKDLEKNDKVFIDIDYGLRTEEEQQAVIDELTEMYGAKYAHRTAATPGYSEHHTGLALDIYLIIGGKNVYLNDEMMKYPEVWKKIHAKLADYGFILRYPKGSGYMYEPWHIRYTGKEAAGIIMSKKGYTLENYLKDYGG